MRPAGTGRFHRCPMPSRRSLGAGRLACGLAARRRTPPPCRPMRLLRQRAPRSCLPPFSPQGSLHRPRPPGRRFAATMRLAAAIVTRSLLPGPRRSLASFRRAQLHSCPPGFRKPNRNGLLRRRRSVFALANMVHFFPHEFTRLCAGCLPFPRILHGRVQWFLFPA